MAEQDVPMDQPKVSPAPSAGASEAKAKREAMQQELTERLLSMVEREIGQGEARQEGAWNELRTTAAKG